MSAAAPGACPVAYTRRHPGQTIHRFGAALNRHVHVHCCVLDGVFEAGQGGQVLSNSMPIASY